jgi:PAS domain S-box-containing protein
MWIDRRLLRLRQHRALGVAASALFVGAAIAIRVAAPPFPPFLTFFPAVVLSAFVGGRPGGLLALAATGSAVPFFLEPEFRLPSHWGWAQLVAYFATAGLVVFIVGLLDNAITRLRAERERLNLALRAANAGTWEWVGTEIHWDRTFYEVTGLDPERHPPSLDTYFAHIHPEDRPRMQRLRNVLAGEEEPVPVEEFRFNRPDGKMIWLQTYRAMVDRGERHVTGVTQDITARKENEMRVALLLREVTHRAKNQYAVIAAVLRETAKTARPEKLVDEVEARLRAMARSQDLLVHGKWQGVALDSVVRTQLAPVRDWRTVPGLGHADHAVAHCRAIYRHGALRAGDQLGQIRRAGRARGQGDDQLVARAGRQGE